MALTYAGSIWCEAGKRLLRWASMAKIDDLARPVFTDIAAQA
jgi:hypothetical protein